MPNVNLVASHEPSQPADPKLAGCDRVLAVLRRLGDYPRGVGFEQLARELDIPKSSLHRALATLCRAGLADHDERGSYRLGLEFVRLAFAYYEQLDRRQLVGPLLLVLAERLGETAHYAELDRAEVVYLAKMTPPGQGVQMTSIVGGRNPAHCTGLGKALLAYELVDRGAVDAYVIAYGPLAQRTPNTLVDAQTLAANLELVRDRGYALDAEESEVGINCIAFPLFLDHPTRPAGAVSVAALAHRTALAQLEEAAAEVRGLIERTLGTVTR
jgi:IclR family transcriptional regulator, acetate operon repressor